MPANRTQRVERVKERLVDRLHTGMYRPGATKGYNGKVARIVASLHGYEPKGIDHSSIRDFYDAVCCRHDVEPQWLGAPLFNGARCRLHVQLDVSAKKVVRIETAQDQVRIGDGRFLTAPTIAYRSGVGTSALMSLTALYCTRHRRLTCTTHSRAMCTSHRRAVCTTHGRPM